MNAIQFIQQHGVEKAREVVEGAPTRTNHYCANNYWFWDGTTLKRTAGDGFFIHSIWGASEEWVSKAVKLSDLKRLVESVDQINALGGIYEAKNLLGRINKHGSRYAELFERPALEQAIADYEQLFGNTETLELETLRDCDTSPNCKKFDERVK
ncbi:hypothetical protein [Acinetobacter junii]|uniref:hypothetical protein n=1 Tax=Acinetobacter junii TaxID=40215 RepID=UPI0030176F63